MSIKLGVIADDFTGATDAASFLIRGGNKTALLTEITEDVKLDCDCLVVALKIRSIDKNEAIKQVSNVLDYFDKIGVEHIYYKYCSTFDSTDQGNIGPVMDYLIERYDQKYSILCPALPVNKRIVKNGHLFVDGIPLDESPLKNHPLNPMWDSYIPNLMAKQSKYPCFVTKTDDSISEQIDNLLDNTNDHFYVVPDYYDDEHGKTIADRFSDLKILSGGSGLLEWLYRGDFKSEDLTVKHDKGNAIILCGSCSEMTNRQVAEYKKDGGKAISIDAFELLKGTIKTGDVFDEIIRSLPKATLVYSDGCEIKLDHHNDNFAAAGKAMEKFLAELAFLAKEKGFSRIVVAGGETSGAVTQALSYKAFYVGKSIAPGVPILRPVEDIDKIVILKSGNFGDETFFIKSLEVD